MANQIKASHILVKTEQEANRIMGEINTGASFAELAKKFSTCPSGKSGGDLGFFGRGQMVKAFEDAAFEAAKGTTVGPVRTEFGYHLIVVTEHK